MQASSEAKKKSRLAAFQTFPRNNWYVGASTKEIGDAPLGREILGDMIVFYRRASGKIVAARDACPHRGFPLSDSHMRNGTIQCRYHGIKFDGNGKCVRIPTSDKIADNMKLIMYPTFEKWLWVWIWMGDPALADPSLIPDFENQDNPEYDHHFLSPIGPHLGNVQMMQENLCDPSHASFLHAGLIDDKDTKLMAVKDRPVTRVSDDCFVFRGDMPGYVANEHHAELFHIEPGKTYNFRQDIWHYAPGFCVVNAKMYDPATKVDDQNWGEVVTDATVVIGLTPANDREFYHMTAMCTSFKQDQKDWDIQLHVIHQDVEAAARMQTYYEKHWQDAVEVSIPLDRPGLLARRMVAKKVKAERASVEHKSC